VTTPKPAAPQALPIAVALALVVTAGLVHGRWTRRWSGSPELAAAVAGLRRFPEAVGGRPGRPFALSDEELAMAEIDGYVARVYDDPQGGAPVTVLLACGRPGPLSVHTPDVCFASGGYAPVREPARGDVPVGATGRVAEVRSAVFRKTNSVVPAYRHVLWSWTTSGTWEAPDIPRVTFASRPVLYKLYVVRESDTAGVRAEDDPGLKFLQTLLPELGRTLFGAQ
jgi:hypothetical protein